MPRRDDIQSVLVVGSAPIVIGQAAEFDYTGTPSRRTGVAHCWPLASRSPMASRSAAPPSSPACLVSPRSTPPARSSRRCATTTRMMSAPTSSIANRVEGFANDARGLVFFCSIARRKQ